MAETDAEPIPRASVFEGTNPVVEGGNSFAPFEGVVTGVNVRLKSFSEGNSEQVGQNVFGNRDGVFPSGLDVNPDRRRQGSAESSGQPEIFADDDNKQPTNPGINDRRAGSNEDDAAQSFGMSEDKVETNQPSDSVGQSSDGLNDRAKATSMKNSPSPSKESVDKKMESAIPKAADSKKRASAEQNPASEEGSAPHKKTRKSSVAASASEVTVIGKSPGRVGTPSSSADSFSPTDSDGKSKARTGVGKKGLPKKTEGAGGSLSNTAPLPLALGVASSAPSGSSTSLGDQVPAKRRGRPPKNPSTAKKQKTYRMLLQLSFPRILSFGFADIFSMSSFSSRHLLLRAFCTVLSELRLCSPGRVLAQSDGMFALRLEGPEFGSV